jgi:hypothetical protein
VSAPGRLPARPTTISEKNTPIDSAVPLFWNVARMPDTTPRSLGRTLPVIADVFGAANMPLPIPLSAINNANAQYGKLIGSSIRPTN